MLGGWGGACSAPGCGATAPHPRWGTWFPTARRTCSPGTSCCRTASPLFASGLGARGKTRLDSGLRSRGNTWLASGLRSRGNTWLASGLRLLWCALAALLLSGCPSQRDDTSATVDSARQATGSAPHPGSSAPPGSLAPPGSSSHAAGSAAATVASSGTAPSPPAPGAAASAGATGTGDELVLIAGGDVSFGRMRGQRLLREPDRDDFKPLRALLDAADVRFVNLESTITDRNGQTQSPGNNLVFTAPPPTAQALARARIDMVSLANNHAWDYGQKGLLETLRRLDAANIAYVGAGTERALAYGPKLVSRGGMTLAFVAVTEVWNQPFSPHPGKELVADAQRESLLAAIAEARRRPGVDKVIVSYHGGYEYIDRPHPQGRALLRAALEGGADVVLGHHPHVVQRVAFVGGKPVLYSLGNTLMRMASGKPWTEIGVLARLRLRRDGPTEVSLCPLRHFGLEPIPLAGDPRRAAYQAMVKAKLDRLQRHGALEEPDSAAVLGAFGEDGCVSVTPR